MPKLTLATLFASLLAISCQSPGYEPPPAGAMEEGKWEARVNLSTSVKAHIAVREVRETRQFGLLRVQIDLQNLQQNESSFRSSVEWFDVSGFKLDSPNDGWMSKIAQPQEKFTVSAGAVNPDAVSWRLNVDTWAR
ncbi:MAG: hypothetical protein ACI9F9_001211 [Candidatus Paceibacteria bacterium]|jgi:uncharacterized protein YcfL